MIGGRQSAHFRAGAVARPVSGERLIPAACDIAPRGKPQVARAPVAGHEAFDITIVPRDILGIQQTEDRSLFSGLLCRAYAG